MEILSRGRATARPVAWSDSADGNAVNPRASRVRARDYRMCVREHGGLRMRDRCCTTL